MAQVTWVYLDDYGGRHRVGLYHGDHSGHLMIHINRRVVQIDFSVRESRTYSIFIEDELCEVQIFKEKIGYSYDFQVNKKVDTPKNRVRRVEERRNRFYMAYLIGGLVLMLALMLGGLWWYRHREREQRLADTGISSGLTKDSERRLIAEGKVAKASMFFVQEALHRKIFYSFTTADSIQITGLWPAPDTGVVMLPNGFPLSDQDAFQVRYLPADPKVHQVNFSEPASATLAGYLKKATEVQIRNHPDDSPEKSLCFTYTVMMEKGWKALADVLYQNLPPEQRPQHNRDAYLRLLRDPAVEKALREKCW